MDLGGLRLTIVDGGSLRLDGASLYGVFPRVYWELMNTPDEDNRVLLSTAPAVIETDEGAVVVDPGIGDGWGPGAIDRYALDGQRTLSDMLADAGVAPADVRGVIATHLHFDHVSASVNTTAAMKDVGAPTLERAEDLVGDLEPAFPSATFYVQASELESARQPELRAASYVTPAVCDAYRRAGRLELLNGPASPFPGVEIEPTGGHTSGHQVVWLKGKNQTVLLPGDLLPTTTHLRGEVMEGVDLEPSVSAAAKASLMSRALGSGSLITFYHAPRVRWGRLRSGLSGKYELEGTLTVDIPGPRRGDRSE